MNKTKIEYVNYTWNPITGCLEGCFYCYAKRIADRFHKPFIPQFHQDRLAQPLNTKKPSRIFVCSMSDFWGDGVNPQWREDIITKVFRYCPQHTFLILTKQPHFISQWEVERLPDNVWLGVTITCDDDSWRQIDLHKRFKGKTFVSIEPFLKPITDLNFEAFGWVIIGAMTGYGSEQYKPKEEDVQVLLNNADNCGIPVFMKNNLKPYWDRKFRQEIPCSMSKN